MNYAAVASMPLSDFTARVWCAWGMVANSRLGWDVADKGYLKGFLPNHLRPVLDRGWRRFKLHRPYGDDSAKTGEPMNEDSRVENHEPASLDLDRMFWTLDATDPDAIGLCYMGSGWDPDMGRLLSRGKWGTWLDRKRRSILGIIDCPNCDIGYDHSATFNPDYERSKGGQYPGFPPESWRLNWQWVELVSQAKRMQGRKVWIESVPQASNPAQNAYPFICSTFTAIDLQGSRYTQREWLRSRPRDDANYPPLSGNEGVTPSQNLTGWAMDYDRILGRHPLEEYAKAIGDVLARGPQWHWAGALNYLPTGAATVHKAVIDYAAQKAEGTDGREDSQG